MGIQSIDLAYFESLYGIKYDIHKNINFQTPDEWLKTWEGPKVAPDFLQGVVQRVASIQLWVTQMEKGTLLTEPVNLSDLFNAESFLSAFKQQCAR